MLTRIAPILAVAYWTNTHSATFGAQIPTRSPVLHARAEQPERQRVDLRHELRVGPAAPGGHLDEGLAVGTAGGGAVEAVADRVAEQRDVGGSGGVRREGRGHGDSSSGGCDRSRLWRSAHPASAPPPPPPPTGRLAGAA